MSQANHQALLEAVKMAMNAEQEAAAFYEKAAGNTGDPRGRDMFLQLVTFEKSHYVALGKLQSSLEGGEFQAYKGTAFSATKPGVPLSDFSPKRLKTDIDALNFAIEAEKKARATYLDLAGSAPGQEVADFFKKLAAEEQLHQKVLEDQFYALSNRGYWTWGE